MDIDILHVAGCPHVVSARRHMREALIAAQVHASVREVEITTADEAARLGMHGSPTILLNGRDLFPTDAEIGSRSCRLYASDDAWAGVPSVDQLVDVIAGAGQRLSNEEEA